METSLSSDLTSLIMWALFHRPRAVDRTRRSSNFPATFWWEPAPQFPLNEGDFFPTGNPCYTHRMGIIRWALEHGESLIQSLGIILGLLFTGAALRAETRSRQLENLIRITEGHRALWTYFDERPELSRLFHLQVDLEEHPLTGKESRFVQFLLNHLLLTFRAQRKGLLQSPEHLQDDIRAFFSLPIPRSAWEKVRRYQDADFRHFIEDSLSPKGGNSAPAGRENNKNDYPNQRNETPANSDPNRRVS